MHTYVSMNDLPSYTDMLRFLDPAKHHLTGLNCTFKIEKVTLQYLVDNIPIVLFLVEFKYLYIVNKTCGSHSFSKTNMVLILILTIADCSSCVICGIYQVPS